MSEELLINKIVQWNYPDEILPKPFLKKYFNHIKKLLRDTKNYLSYEIHNGKIIKLVFANFRFEPVEMDRINVMCFYIDKQKLNIKMVKEELRKLHEYFLPKKINLSLSTSVFETKLIKYFKNLGFVIKSTKLKAQTSDSYLAISKMCLKPLPVYYSIDHMEYDKDIDAVMKIELRSHRNEPTSIVHNLPRKEFESFRYFLKELSLKKTVFVLKFNEKTIGVIAHNIRKNVSRNSTVTTVSIDPKFKGSGLSKYLYKTLVMDLKKKNVDEYYGYSSTKQVLRFAKILQRHPIRYSLVLEKKLLREL